MKMKLITIEWDKIKNNKNIIKHKVDFIEAQTVFYDENAIIISDPDHSDNEERFLILGLSEKFRVLVVSHCYRNNDEKIRIISARKATKEEQATYKRRLN
jgi:uncharacterized DUF497 family protein